MQYRNSPPETQYPGEIVTGLDVLPSPGLAETPSIPLVHTLTNNRHEDSIQAKTERKRRSVSLSRRIFAFDSRRGERMANCGRRFSLAVSKCLHRYETGIKNPKSFDCGDRLCPECARKRSAKLVNRLSKPLRLLKEKNDLHASFVTLTLKNTERLPASRDLVRWKKRLLASKFWNQYGLFGSIGSLEIKLGSGSGLWHVHFHLVTFTKYAIPEIQIGSEAGKWQVAVNQELSEAWEKANDGNGFIVRGVSFDGNYQEILKYMSKGAEEMSDEQLEEYCQWSKGKRGLFLTGKLYANKELKRLLEEAQAEKLEAVEASHSCPECGCRDFERHDYEYDSRIKSFVITKVSDFQFREERKDKT